MDVPAEPSGQNPSDRDAKKPWIRGVNIGGWLMAERFITPYFFAVTTCHLQGDFCWYPGQIDAPPRTDPDYKECDLYKCQPHKIVSASGEIDYPTDEWTLASSFPSRQIAKRYFEYHWDNFVTRDDVVALKQAGVSYIRVPLSHWILGDIQPGEPWVDGGWIYFVRFVNWCRDEGIQVWPDIHTAPGSQNGFDNSGQLLQNGPTCAGWSQNPENVQRSLDVIRNIVNAIRTDSLQDVVTGFGILNEPFIDCGAEVVRQFNRQAFDIVQDALGKDVAIYIGDMFRANHFNDGYWIDPSKYNNTFLDSHIYHVFAEAPRALSPKQHIAYVCGKNHRDTTACCFEDYPYDTKPSQGISRLIGEWSAAFDTLPVAKLRDIMDGIAETGEAPEYNRKLSAERKRFLRNFVKAQMVVYEAQDVGVSRGWFYWTFKMEGGAFAEWDFLRGVREGWIPPIPSEQVSSQDLYGTCHQIAESTDDDTSIVNEFPDPSTLPAVNWQGVAIDDDYVVSHAGSLNDPAASEEEEEVAVIAAASMDVVAAAKEDVTYSEFQLFQDTIGQDPSDPKTESPGKSPTDLDTHNTTPPPPAKTQKHHAVWPAAFFFGFVAFAVFRVFRGRHRHHYTSIDAPSTLTV